MRSIGFTLVELMVVLGIVSIMIIAGMVGFNHYKEQYAFSAAVRGLTNAVTVARVRAMQAQSTSRLVLRPQNNAAPIQNWQVGQGYKVGDVVMRGRWTYRCLQNHTSVATFPAPSEQFSDNFVTVNGVHPNLDKGTNCGNEPNVTAYWDTIWEIISDYQYNDLLLDVQHCAGDPTTCTWLNANPYNTTTPVSIQFNWFGVPVDYQDHNIRAQGAHDLALSRTQTVGDLTLTVTALGRIRHRSGTKFVGENE